MKAYSLFVMVLMFALGVFSIIWGDEITGHMLFISVLLTTVIVEETNE